MNNTFTNNSLNNNSLNNNPLNNNPLNMNTFNGLTLTNEQHRILNIYVNQYNQSNSQVQCLLNIMDEIKENIISVIDENASRRNRQVRRSNTALNRAIHTASNNRQNNYIRYDLNQPINPGVYRRNQLNANNNLRQGSFFTTILDDFLNLTVDIVPTEEQILNASRIIRYGDIETPLTESCPISLEQFNENSMVVQLLPCNHLFCQSQFNEWFRRNARCPVCRYDIRNYRQNASQLPNDTVEEREEEQEQEQEQEQEPNTENTQEDLTSQINNITSRIGNLTDEQIQVLYNSLRNRTNARPITERQTTERQRTERQRTERQRTTERQTTTERQRISSLSNVLTDVISNAVNSINNNSNSTNEVNPNNVIEFIEYISYI
jgi:hypothetical protein